MDSTQRSSDGSTQRPTKKKGTIEARSPTGKRRGTSTMGGSFRKEGEGLSENRVRNSENMAVYLGAPRRDFTRFLGEVRNLRDGVEDDRSSFSERSIRSKRRSSWERGQRS